MAEQLWTPIDEIGMPLPLAPLPESLTHASLRQPDWHHHFHPRRSSVLQDLGGQAVRNVRLQLSNWEQHHNDYHGYFYGPPLPETQAEKFGVVVLASAGYVPAEAIDFNAREPHTVRLTPLQRERLWSGGELRTAAPDIIRRFLTDYTINQDIHEVHEKLIDEFLHTENNDRKYELGGVLIGFAIDKASEPLSPFYRRAWKKGYIQRNSAARIQRLIRTKMRFNHQLPQLINKLSENLAA